ncbi:MULTISPECIES: type VI secretion system-associated FHA domain protein TagH [Cupriavidus]
MNATPADPRVMLVIENPQALQQGSTPRHSFDRAGGTIGSAGAGWTLHDRAGHVLPVHCELRYEDGGFFVIDRCGQTSVNGQTRPLGMLASARLRHGDLLHIGPYRVSVNLDDERHVLPDPSRHLSQHDVGELLGTSLSSLDTLPGGEERGAMAPLAAPDGWEEFQRMAQPPQSGAQLDPLQALDAAERLQRSPGRHDESLDPHHYGLSALAAQPDLAATRMEAVSGMPMLASGDTRMTQPDPHASAAARWQHAQQASGHDPAGAAAPLVEGLGAPVGALDAQAAYDLLFEAGQSLGALIRGIAALHGAAREQPHGQGLAGRTLQPIEDNPLRLGQSYPDTVRALFSSGRSLVHLSPTAAVDESLEQIRRQQSATLKAISAGLGALLQAFAPDQLERRFHRYRAGQSGQPAGDWAWQMYGHYYQELMSGRQKGFDKLFWEVFDQAYDQALRAEAQ